jgi:hypothetical protein
VDTTFGRTLWQFKQSTTIALMHALIDKLEIADELIETAIKLYLDDKRYASALNLAGVADEIYGKWVRIRGGEDALSSNVLLANAIARLDGSSGLPMKDWKKIARTAKNMIKHMDSISDREIEIDLEDEARALIGDALINHGMLERNMTATLQRFYDFGREWSATHTYSTLSK